MNEKRKSGPGFLFWYAAGLIALLLIWMIFASLVDSPILLPDPVSVLKKLLVMAGSPLFLRALRASLIRVFASVLISVPLSVLIGVAAGLNKNFNAFIRPLFSVISATPVLSIILIAFIWFGQERTPIFAAFLIMFPVMTANTIQGVRSADSKLVEALYVYNFSRRELLRHLYVPSLLPYLFAGLHSSLSLCWKVVVASEVIVQPLAALGTGMQNAKAMLETTELFAWTAATVIVASLTESVFKLIVQRSYKNMEIQRMAL